MGNNLQTLIDAHLNHFNATEKKDFERARRYYAGDFLYDINGANHSPTALDLFASKNIIYAITDTALSSLLGTSPRVAPVGRDAISRSLERPVGAYLDWAFRANRMRRRTSNAIIDATLCKRAIFKTCWDYDNEQPEITTVDPADVFFDLNVRDPDYIGYWLQAVAMPWHTFQALVDKSYYTIPASKTVTPGSYPRWMLDAGRGSATSSIRNEFRYVELWEYYDVARGKVYHYVPSISASVLEDQLAYNPFTMFSLSQNGVDCSGMSEVQLLLDSQRTVNDLLSHWKRIVYLQTPRTLFDKSRITDTALGNVLASTLGSFHGVQTDGNGAPGGKFADMFFPMPLPAVPASTQELLAKTEEDMAFTSSLAEAARGRVSGAKSATEMAIIDAYNRTRLATREGHLNEALEDVARKVLYLGSRNQKTPKVVRISGRDEFTTLALDDLRAVDMDFELVGYNPMRSNPAVVLDTIVQLLPAISQAPNVDVVSLIEEVVDRFGLPPRILRDGDVVRAELARAKAGAPPGGAPPPGAPPGGALPEDPTAMPPGDPASDPALMDAAAAGNGLTDPNDPTASLRASLAATGRAATSGGSPAAALPDAPEMLNPPAPRRVGRPPLAGTGA